jgi:tetratricopeptide (TPR) repeat protein
MTSKEEVVFKKLFFNANREKILGNYEDAAELFAQCIRKDPSSAASMYELSRLYLDAGKFSEALFFAEKATIIDQENIWYLYSLAEMQLLVNEAEKATKTYQKIISQFPENLPAYYDLADAFMKAGKPNASIKIYDQIESLIGVTEDLCLQKERIYISLNKIEKAADEIAKLIEKHPNEIRYYGMLAELYQANNKIDIALTLYEKMLTIEPNDPNIHMSLAGYYKSIGNKIKSFEHLQIAFGNTGLGIKKKTEILSSFYVLSSAYPELKEQAILLCELLIKAHPNEPMAFSTFGDFLFQDGHLSDARKQFKKALELDSSQYVIWRQLLQVESESRDFDALLKESTEAIELFPTQSVLYLYCGIANLQKKNLEEALIVLKKGVDLTPDNEFLLSSFYSNLGDTYHSQKDTLFSDSSYNMALKYNPKNMYVLNNYSYYLSLRGSELDKAADMSKKAIALDPGNTSFQDTYGWILYKMGDFTAAKEWIKKALESGGDERSVILEHYGDILFKLGDKDSAIKYWKLALSKGSGTKLLQKKITELKLYE